jgi:hypothetical protein
MQMAVLAEQAPPMGIGFGIAGGGLHVPGQQACPKVHELWLQIAETQSSLTKQEAPAERVP